MSVRRPTYAELRDDLAHDLRGTILITKPASRCPNDEEAEAIAKVAICHFHDLSWRADLNDRILEVSRELYDRLTQFQINYLRIETAISDLIEAKRNLDKLMKGPIE